MKSKIRFPKVINDGINSIIWNTLNPTVLLQFEGITKRVKIKYLNSKYKQRSNITAIGESKGIKY